MDSIFSTLSVLYPVLFSILLIIVLLNAKIHSAQEAKITINLGFTELTIPFIKSLWLIRFFLVIAIIGFFIFPLFRNYSSYFPKNYKLTVSYDNKDIKKALHEFHEEDIEKYLIDKDWEKNKEIIWQSIIQNISKKMSKNIDANKVPMVAVNGHTFFSIKKAGFLRYDLEDSYGILDHELLLPTGDIIKVFTRFKLERMERFNIRIRDIYLKRGIVVEGRFRQYLYSQNELIYLFKIIAITNVKFLPAICVGETIYLYENPDGSRTPIGIAVNSPIETK